MKKFVQQQVPQGFIILVFHIIIIIFYISFLEQELNNFPVDLAILKPLRERIRLARKLDSEEYKYCILAYDF